MYISRHILTPSLLFCVHIFSFEIIQPILAFFDFFVYTFLYNTLFHPRAKIHAGYVLSEIGTKTAVERTLHYDKDS